VLDRLRIVDYHPHPHHACHGPAANHHVVEGVVPAEDFRAAHQLGAQHPPVFQPEVAFYQVRQTLQDLVGLVFGQEAQAAKIDTGNRDPMLEAHPCRAQDGPIAAQRD